MTDKRFRFSADVRREQILEAANRLFIERGFANVQMGDIAEQIGTSRPNIYTHFKSTADILDALLERFTGLYIAALKERNVHRLEETVPETFEVMLQQREMLQLLRSAGAPIIRPYRQKVTAALTAYMEETLGSQVPTEQRAAFEMLVSMQNNLYLDTAYEVIAEPEHYDREQVKKQLEAMLHAAYALALPQIHEEWKQFVESRNQSVSS